MTSDERRDDRQQGDERQVPIGFIAFLLVALAAVLFVLQNRDEAPVDFLFVEVQSRQWIIIAISIALGVVLDRLFVLWWRRRRMRG